MYACAMYDYVYMYALDKYMYNNMQYLRYTCNLFQICRKSSANKYTGLGLQNGNFTVLGFSISVPIRLKLYELVWSAFLCNINRSERKIAQQINSTIPPSTFSPILVLKKRKSQSWLRLIKCLKSTFTERDQLYDFVFCNN